MLLPYVSCMIPLEEPMPSTITPTKLRKYSNTAKPLQQYLKEFF